MICLFASWSDERAEATVGATTAKNGTGKPSTADGSATRARGPWKKSPAMPSETNCGSPGGFSRGTGNEKSRSKRLFQSSAAHLAKRRRDVNNRDAKRLERQLNDSSQPHICQT